MDDFDSWGPRPNGLCPAFFATGVIEGLSCDLPWKHKGLHQESGIEWQQIGENRPSKE